MRLRGKASLILGAVLLFAGCESGDESKLQTWLAYGSSEKQESREAAPPPAAPAPKVLETAPALAARPAPALRLPEDLRPRREAPEPGGLAPHLARREAFEAALPERRDQHDQDLWNLLTSYDEDRRRSEVLAALLSVRGEREIVTALDWIMSRLYEGKGSSAYLAAYALLHEQAGLLEGAIWGDLLARLRIAEDAARCAYLPAAKDKMMMIRQLLAPLSEPLNEVDPEVQAALAAHVLAENRDLPRNRDDSWLCRGGPNYTAQYFRKHGGRPNLQALRIETRRQTMVLLPDDPEIETGGFRDDAAWETSIAGLRDAFRRKYGIAE